MELEETDIEDSQEAGWQYSEPFNMKAHDGETDIYGLSMEPIPVLRRFASLNHLMGFMGSEQSLAEFGICGYNSRWPRTE